MSLADFCELMDIEDVPDSIVLAASILQAKGKRFCVDFGFYNAVEMAEEALSKD
jgi:hypothetical protein